MNSKTSEKNPKTRFGACALLAGLLAPMSAHSYVDKSASIDASGEGVVYDVKATAAGTLNVCTKAARAGDRWRVTIAEANQPSVALISANSAFSNVGNGSATTFSGCVSKPLAANVPYIVAITWDRPLPGTFSASVTARFSDSNSGNPPVTGVDGTALSLLTNRPISFVESGQTCPLDGTKISCGAHLTNCNFDNTSETDAFVFDASAYGTASIKICGPSGSLWRLFGPTGEYITSSFGSNQGSLPVTGTYTIETRNTSRRIGTYSLSLGGVSQTFQCGVPIVFGQTKSGTFDSCADQDTFQFVCQANQVVSINIAGPSGSLWELFGPTGEYITSSFGSNQGECTQSGTHTILVQNTSGRTGAYNLTLQQVSLFGILAPPISGVMAPFESA